MNIFSFEHQNILGRESTFIFFFLFNNSLYSHLMVHVIWREYANQSFQLSLIFVMHLLLDTVRAYFSDLQKEM